MTTDSSRSAVEAMIAHTLHCAIGKREKTEIADMLLALLTRAESAEAERDAGDVVWKSSVALLEAQDARIKTSEHKAQCALDSHEGQVRNTLAFKAERDEARAELAALRAEAKAVVGPTVKAMDAFMLAFDAVDDRVRSEPDLKAWATAVKATTVGQFKQLGLAHHAARAFLTKLGK